MKSKKELTNAFSRNEEEKLLLASLLDKQEAASVRGIPSSTKFLNQAERAVCCRLLDHIHAEYHIFGGYEGAERAVICFLPDYLDEGWLLSEDGPLAAVRVSYKGNLSLTHRDFLGSLMGTGIAREAVGDILTEENVCHFLVLRELMTFVLQNMTSAGRAALELTEIPLGELPTPERKFEEKRATVMSLRLDAVVSAAFNLSRDSAAQYVNAGRVSLNHLECLKGDKPVRDADILSVKGLGRVQVFETGARSKRGRIAILLKKYI